MSGDKGIIASFYVSVYMHYFSRGKLYGIASCNLIEINQYFIEVSVWHSNYVGIICSGGYLRCRVNNIMVDYLAAQAELKLNHWSFYNKDRVVEAIDMDVYEISIGFKNMNILLNKKETSMKTLTNRLKSGGWNGDKLLEPIVLCYRTVPLKENEIF